MNYSLDDLLTASGKGKTTKFKTVGDSYTGKVVSVDIRQDKDDKTGEPEFWPDGNPKLRAVIGLQTDLRDPEIEGDDGIRYDYVKMWNPQKKAFLAATQAAGGSPKPGDTYSTKFIGEEPPKNPMHSPTKLFEFHFVKANPLDAALGGGFPQAAAPAAQAAPAPVVQAAPQYQAPVAQAPVGLGAAAPTELTPQQADQIATLISKALTDDQIAPIIGVPVQAVAQVRMQSAALANSGF